MHTFTIKELNMLIAGLSASFSDCVKQLGKVDQSHHESIEKEIEEIGALKSKVRSTLYSTIKSDIVSMDELKKIYLEEGKIPAIKSFRARYNLGLKESKEFIEELCGISNKV